MRSTLSFFLCLFLCAVHGQDHRLGLGAEGGVGMGSLLNKTILGPAIKPMRSTVAGVFGQYNFTGSFSLRLGVHYEGKGYVIRSIATDINGQTIGEFDQTETFTYLTIPVLARATFGGGPMNVFVNAGPYLGLLMRQMSVNEGFGSFTGRADDRTSHFESLDLGLSAGFGISRSVGERVGLSLELRNNAGLINISKGTHLFKEVQLNNLHVLLGLAIKLSRFSSAQ